MSILKKVKKKIGTEEMAREDMMALFNIMHNPQFTREMKKFCDLYKLDREIFKDGQRYSFKPLWNEIFLVLFAVRDFHPQSHGNKKSQNVREAERRDLDIEILKFVEKYLKGEVKKKIKEHPTAELARIRTVLMEKAEEKMEMIRENLRYYPAGALLEDFDDLLKTLDLAVIATTPDGKTGLNRRVVEDGKMSVEDFEVQREQWYRTIDKDNLEEVLVNLLKLLANFKNDICDLTIITEDDPEKQKQLNEISKNTKLEDIFDKDTEKTCMEKVITGYVYQAFTSERLELKVAEAKENLNIK